MSILIINDHALPSGLAERLVDGGWEIHRASDYEGAVAWISRNRVCAILMARPGPRSPFAPIDLDGDEHYQTLFQLIEGERIPALMAVDEPHRIDLRTDTLIDFVEPGIGAEGLLTRLSTVLRYHRQIKRVETELNNMNRLGKRLNQHFSAVDQEMRLASRLQRDFLPKIHEPIEGFAFHALFRPASWVSGDIFDVFRVDEEHVAFYMADAVGHGMASGLLTIFIKQAIVSKEITPEGYRVLEPGETLALLNRALKAQTLPHAQFVTACYALLNTRTMKFRFARAGHPYPLLVNRRGRVTELQAMGGLLGLFDEETFESAEVQLRPGDKVILHTDGMELSFQDKDAKFDTRAYLRAFERLGRLSLREMIQAIERQLDQDAGSLHPRDDVSILGFEVPLERADRSEALTLGGKTSSMEN